jgi:hypothetical protein
MDMLVKVRGERTSATEKITKSCWWFWKEWELNLALKAAQAKFFVVSSGGCELLTIKVVHDSADIPHP